VGFVFFAAKTLLVTQMLLEAVAPALFCEFCGFCVERGA
jgi:hypothetical protein